MTENEARAAIAARVPRETLARLETYVDMLREANARQNLVSPTSLGLLWQRHILDSVQLAEVVQGTIVDVGTGAGLPGLVLAMLGLDTTLVEPRRMRVAFLQSVSTAIGLSVDIRRSDIRAIDGRFATITARAVAPLDRLLTMTAHLAGPATRWVLPKGRNVHAELEVARRAWHGRFTLVPSITDPSAMVVVAEQLRPRAHR